MMPPDAAMTRVAVQPSIEVALQHIHVIQDVPLARVNGQEIYWEDYLPSLYQALNKVSREGSVNWSDPAMQQRLGQLQNEVLKQTADRWALRLVGEELGIALPPEMVDQELQAQKDNVAKSPVYSSWEDYLARNGYTEQSVRQVVSDTIMLVSMVEIQEVEKTEEQVHLAHILVATQDVAQEVIDRLDAGAEFAELAAEYSQDEDTRDKGGDLGWMAPSDLMPNLLAELESLPPGDYTQPISTSRGYTIVLFEGREVRDSDPQAIRVRQQQKLLAWFETKKAEMTIEVLVDFQQPQ